MIMNERIKELAKQAGHTVFKEQTRSGDYVEFDNFNAFDIEKFARLIINECVADPKVYILNRKDNTWPESTLEIHGWTSDLKLAQQWRASSHRGEDRDFYDIYFMKEIKSL